MGMQARVGAPEDESGEAVISVHSEITSDAAHASSDARQSRAQR